jgi:RNA polymerase sigma-70 factor (ECF subfamily)
MVSDSGEDVSVQNNFGAESDLELVSAAQQGSGEALSELAARNYRRSMKLALSLLRHREDAEEEVQNAFLKAFGHIRQFKQDSQFSTWLTRIVVNNCLMNLRRRSRNRPPAPPESEAKQPERFEIRDNSATAEEMLGREQVRELLHLEIRRLPPLLRNVLLLRHVEGLSMEEVARRLGISVVAAKSRLLRARREARARLSRHCGVRGPATLMI